MVKLNSWLERHLIVPVYTLGFLLAVILDLNYIHVHRLWFYANVAILASYWIITAIIFVVERISKITSVRIRVNVKTLNG